MSSSNTRFPQPVIRECSRINPSPLVGVLGSDVRGGFMLVSSASERRWHVIDFLQKCMFGVVLRAVEVARSPHSGEWTPQAGRGYFAIKQMDTATIISSRGQIDEDPEKEVAALQYIKANGPHASVIEITEALHDGGFMYIISPLCNGGELFNLVSTRRAQQGGAARAMGENEARTLFRGVMEGVQVLHGLQICHRDLSLENILLHNNLPKIVDLGMALMLGQPQSRHGMGAAGGIVTGIVSSMGESGKRRYRAPEVAMNQPSFDGFAVDIWACGVILYIMLFGRHPFEEPIPERDYCCHIIAVQGRLADLLAQWHYTISPQAADLMQSCLRFEPRARASAHDILRHPWLAS